MADLKDLADNREAILLSEVAAWLHDDFKHTDEHIKKYVAEAPSPSGKQDTEDLIPNRSLTLLGKSIPLSDVRKRRRADFVPGYLNRCHYTAHIEKQDGDGSQSYPAYLSSPFGFEGKNTEIPRNLTVGLREEISWNLLNANPFTDNERKALRRKIKTLFSRVGGDTRRPANEITLWEWGHTVGALYKAALAGALLGFQPQANNLRWRLLSVRFNGLRFFFAVNRVPDLQARQKLLTEALDRVQESLEVTYPLGTEVYRDENGSVFVVPGCDKTNCALDILTLQDGGKNLRDYILEKVHGALEGEVVPEITIDTEPWWGQDPQRKGNDELPPIASHLQMVTTSPAPDWVEQQWISQAPSEVCTVCGLRPQGPGKKARDRKMCNVCEKRREDRAKEWAANIGRAFLSTIWLDEVADRHRRIALLVGTFDLTHWLDGTLVRSLAVREPNDQNGHTADKIAKNPSFARLRRIWETTRRFWEETLKEAKGKLMPRPRIFLKGSVQKSTLGPYHAYELEIQGRKVAVLWVPEKDDKVNIPEKYRGGFWVIENLDYLDNVYGRSFQNLVQDLVGQSLKVYEPTEYGRPGETRATFTISADDGVQLVENAYLPLIPILAEPRTFMALVPAESAFDVLRAIKAKYEREMGKVRNRLPLHLGVVFADAHIPLRAILDAGRRMLRQRSQPFGWEVKHVQKQPDEGGTLPERFNDDVKGQFAEWLEIELEKEGQTITWHIPAVMGDGQTEDHWYPYVFWVQDKEGNTEPANALEKRSRYYQAPNPFNMDEEGNPQTGWLVHAGELKPGDRIYFTPATFDFQWLAAGSDRFAIAYDEQGRRQGLPRRPYLLDHLETLEHIWRALQTHTAESQIHALVSLIEAKREEWQVAPENETFRRFCRDVLVNLDWKTDPWRKESLDAWVDYAAQGWLTDAVEIFHGIMKERASTQEEANP